MMNNFLKPGLQDLCVSRTSFKWSIPVDFDPKHVVYVWIDALTNYITGLGYDADGNHGELYKKYWPADLHLIGKDIVRFHTIYWPIMLMALDIPLPKQVFGHPWLLQGESKMSKSKGNVIYADDLVDIFGVDAVRYFVLHEIPYDNDGSITWDLLVERINSDLANVLGNLVNRTIAMSNKYFGGIVENKNVCEDVDQELKDLALAMPAKSIAKMDEFKASNALDEIFNLLRRTNKYIDETMPWALAKDETKKDRLATVLYNLIESIRFSAVMLYPYMPSTATKILDQINTDQRDFESLKEFGNYASGTKVVEKPEMLFARLDPKEVSKKVEVIEAKQKASIKAVKEKKEKEESLTKQLYHFAGSYKYLSILSTILAAISAFVALVPFYYIWKVMQEVLRVRFDFSKAAGISTYGWRAVGFAILGMIIYMAGLMCSHIAAFHVQAQMRTAMMNHIMTLPLGYIESEGTGKIRKIVTDSSAATETYLAHTLPDKAVSKATPIGLIILMAVFDWRLGIMCLIPAAIGFVFMSSMSGKDLAESMKQYQNSLEVMSAEAVEYIRGVPVVKTFGQTVFSFKRFKEAIDEYEKWTLGFTKKMRKPMVGFTTAVNSIFVFIIIAAYVFGGHEITAAFGLNLLFYIIITPILTTTLMKLAYAGEAQMQVVDGLKRMGDVMNRQSLKETTNGQIPKDSSVSLRDVTFAYEGAKKNAVDHISIEIKAGEHVAFVGPSGGGKTTLASMIARFWDVKEGSVKIGGVDVRDITSSELMNQISYVFQDSKLLKMSILENVRLGKPDATDEEVMQALKDAQCMDIIDKFKDGVHTMIGAKGIHVSGGEAQRLSIARAFLKNAPVLILDEATAFADPDNEQKVQKAFENLSKDKTVIMIAHRLSTVTNADRIYVLKDGAIAEEGSHGELLKSNGIYAHMWEEYNKSVNWKVGGVL